jgi:hypothetical protein
MNSFAAIRAPRVRLLPLHRPLCTAALPPHVHAFPDPSNPSQHLLTLLPTQPPTPSLALGSVPSLPPSPRAFSDNPRFAPILHAVLARHAARDPDVVAAAAAAAAAARGRRLGAASPRSVSVGSGGGGWVHVGDARRPPEWGRTPDPEDIFGSLEVDARGRVGGAYQASGTYRVVTMHGMSVGPSVERRWMLTSGRLGLSPFLLEKLVEKLRELEAGAE